MITIWCREFPWQSSGFQPWQKAGRIGSRVAVLIRGISGHYLQGKHATQVIENPAMAWLRRGSVGLLGVFFMYVASAMSTANAWLTTP